MTAPSARARAASSRDRAPTQDHQDAEARALAALERDDSKAALTVLMDTYGDDIYRFCRQFTRDPELAEDLRQVTFVQAYEALPRFARRSTLRAWLYSIARNRCLDATKGRKRWRKRFLLDDTAGENAPVRPPDPAEALDQPALARALAHCLGKLDPDLRTLVIMRHQDELSYVELGRIFDVAPATLQARVARVLPRLRRCLDNQGVSL